MALRSLRERIIQTLAYEVGGLTLSVPLYLAYAGGTAQGSAAMMVALAVAVTLWGPVHNTLFDWIEWRATGRVASDRLRGLRVVHALSLEITAVAVSLPLLVLLGGHSVRDALLVDLGLTLLYSGYAFVFHLLYDLLRPVRSAPSGAFAS